MPRTQITGPGGKCSGPGTARASVGIRA